MITIHELLEDPVYRKYFCTVPQLPAVKRLAEPWRLYVRSDRGWAKKDFFEYKDAFRLFSAKRANILDAAIVCRPMLWTPPTRVVKIKNKFHANGQQITKEVSWQPKLEGHDEDHRWCGRCRRPTVFKYFARHHALTGEAAAMMDQGARRCTICAIRLEFTRGAR